MRVFRESHVTAEALLLRALTLVLVGAVVVFIGGCPDVGPRIDSIVPDHGYVGDTVLINGHGFSNKPAGNTVTFNGTPATVVSVPARNELGVVVPSGATTGPVVVTVDNRPSNPSPFTVLSGSPAVSGVVESIGNIGRVSSLALDSGDQPRIVYSDNPNQKVKYAAWDGTAWIIETIDDYLRHADVSLALSGTGNPQVCYSINTFQARGLRYAKRGTGGWPAQDIDPNQNAGTFNSLTLTPGGDPRIAYWRSGLFFSEFIGGKWVTKPVGPAPAGHSWGHHCSLALDSGANPRVVFYETKTGSGTQPGSVKYAWRSGGTWNVQSVETMIYSSWSALSLALDGANDPKLSYSHNVNPPAQSQLRYAKRVGNAWTIETVVKGYTFNPSLALDAGGNPTIGYYEYDDANSILFLKYAIWDGLSWKFTTVSSWSKQAMPSGAAAPRPSLALDSQGRVHISYYDPVNMDLMYYAQP